jgi:hypothetical protein
MDPSYAPYDPTNPGGNLDYTTNTTDPTNNPIVADPYNVGAPVTDPGATLGDPPTANIPSSSSTASANPNLLAQLASALGGATGANAGLVQQLLGAGSSLLGSTLSSNAAKSAAGTYAGETNYQPYSVSTPGASATYNGTTGTAGLSAPNTAINSGLQGLATTATNALGNSVAPSMAGLNTATTTANAADGSYTESAHDI